MQKILIVDDIFVNRLLLKEIIKSICGQCLEAQNGREAIEIIQKEKVELIFMDIEMPVMNGLETTKYIREKLPAPLRFIPIIALTAHNPANFFDDFQQAGFNYLITKPYSIEKITKAIDEICSK
ncbi:MAG: response regulator [Bacteroidales bacterium]|nr:response regulator [Bacteroidales bacterium]